MNLDLTKFGEFIRCISIFKDLCNDIDIRNGFIRNIGLFAKNWNTVIYIPPKPAIMNPFCIIPRDFLNPSSRIFL